jgi:hypothetical protein
MAGRVVRQPHHGQLRVDRGRGREAAGVGYVQIREAVDAQALAEDPAIRVAADRVSALGVPRVHEDVTCVVNEVTISSRASSSAVRSSW